MVRCVRSIRIARCPPSLRAGGGEGEYVIDRRRASMVQRDRREVRPCRATEVRRMTGRVSSGLNYEACGAVYATR